MDTRDGEGLLDQLDKLPQMRKFDAFPKTQPMYLQRSSRGGLVTLLVGLTLLALAWGEAREYLFGKYGYSFDVDHHIGQQMQINVDVTVAMKCHYLTIDIRDAVGDRLHVSDSEFTKDGTTFEIGHAGRLDSIPERDLSVAGTIDASKVKNSRTTFGNDRRPSRSKAFKKTSHIVHDGPACRIYGSMDAKKVTGNLHITTLGHGYWSWEHTDHSMMNLSHVFHEFSFGPYFPQIAQPLDSSVEVSNEHFAVFQYFVSIIPTTFIDRWNRKLHTNQYSVSDYVRTVKHGQGVPGIFIKYDIEPLTMVIRTRTTTFIQFLVRLAGTIGGFWTVAHYSYRAGDRVLRIVVKMRGGEDTSYEKYAQSYSSSMRTSSYSSRDSSSRWLGGNNVRNMMSGAKDKASNAWGGNGMGHRPTASVAEKIFSGECPLLSTSIASSRLLILLYTRNRGRTGSLVVPAADTL
ncbi:hypothetical protein CBS101457_000364 [Exobasidium rhododendri]|nr:hypothetical protein CBS101457_000364 [Exobasidium rhododendri]